MSEAVYRALSFMDNLRPCLSTRPMHTHEGARKHPTSTGSSILNAGPPPDLTPYIIKIGDQYLAGGGFGDVYRCRYIHGSQNQEVAVKALRFKSTLDGDTDDRSARMLHRELGIWKRLSHDNIVPFLGIAYGFGMSGAMSLVSLWMPNDTLHKFLDTHDNKLDTMHRLQIVYDVSQGLHYLHSFPIVHGDLNSNNVLLDANYTARLSDFGYASLAGNIPEALAYLQRSTSRPGSLRWIAPEQIDLEGTYDKTTKSDIYSLGCVALQVLSGKQPWSEVREDASVVLRLHLGHKPGRPESRAMEDSHWECIQCCWLPLQDRPTAETILHAIQQLLSECTPSKPLRELFTSLSSQSRDPLVGGLSTSLTTTEGSKTNENPLDKARGDQTKVVPHLQYQQHPLAIPSHRLPRSTSTQRKPGTTRWTTAVLGTTSQLRVDDIVVIVIGPHGSGKSTFVGAVTAPTHLRGSPDTPQYHPPPAGKIRATRCELTEEALVALGAEERKHIVFVDTPSFYTDLEEDVGAEREMTAWLIKSKSRFTLSGTIYMHRIGSDTSAGGKSPMQPHLDAFASTFPQDFVARFPERLHCVFNYTDVMNEERLASHQEEIQKQLSELNRPRIIHKWKLTRNASTCPEFFIRDDPHTAWNAVVTLFSGPRH